MIKKGNLFLLIKSLTKSEKRYFSLYAAVGGVNTNYLRLFDAIEAQPEYDETAIRQHFEGEVFTRQLHVTKIYLTELILKSLRNYHADNSVNTRLLNVLRDIELLFNKELYDMCTLKIHKAEQLCHRYEREALLLEVLAWKRKLLLAQSIPVKEITVKLMADEREVIAKLSGLNAYWDKTLHLFGDFNNPGYAPPEAVSSAHTLQAKTLHHHLRYSYYFMKANPAAAEEEITTLIALLEQDAPRIEDDPAPYVTAISNKIGLYIGQQRWAEIPPLIQKMRQVPLHYKLQADSKFTVRLWLRLYNLELEMYRDMQQPEKAIPLIAEAEGYIQTHRQAVPAHYHIMLYYQFAALYFLKNSYSLALDKINEIVNNNYGDTRTDIQCYARILNMLIHFELGNLTVLRYAVDNCRRFFVKHKATNPFNKQVLQMFSALSLARKDEYTTIIKKTHAKCFAAGNEQPMQDYIDISGWMMAKISRTKG